jgi:hypothetical protein
MVAYMWSLGNLLRLGHAAACRELSDRARGCVSTDDREDGAELVERAAQLVAIANDVLELAVASAREHGTSWEDIGEVLPGPDGRGVSRQAATKRFGSRVEQLRMDTLLPRRAAPMAGQLGWTAGPDGVDRPDETAARLDAWALRHRERTDPSLQGRSDHELMSAALRARYRPALDSIGPITLLAQLLLDAMGPFASKPLPPGVTERYARQRLLVFTLAAADAMLDERRRRGGADTVLDRDAIFDELADILAETCRDQLRFDWHDDGQTATVRLHDNALVIVERSDDDRAPDTVGWWLWGIGPDGRSGPGPEWPQPLDISVDAEREHVEHAAATQIAHYIATDQIKGIEPFAPGGIADPTTKPAKDA